VRLILAQAVLLGLQLWVYVRPPGWPLLPEGPVLRGVAFLLLLASAILAVVAFFAIGRSFRVRPEPKASARLVTGGIYAHVRHPMYASVMAACVALFLHSGDAGVGAVAGINVVFYAVKLRYEERLLAARYPGYAAYRRRTRALLPLGRHRT
jgi:protein-S-isoprenylcysteine O-methyltransferase Ste14